MQPGIIQVLIPLLAFFAVAAIGSAVMIAKRQKSRQVKERIRFDRPFSATARPGKGGGLEFLAKVGNIVSHGQASTTLSEQLVRAGYFGASAPAVYTGAKMLLFITGLGAMALLVGPRSTEQMPFITKLILILMGATVLFFIPNFVVMMQLKKRHDEIMRHLPEAIDLLEICVSSGIGLDMAWNLVSDEIQNVSGVLANAMALTNFEIHLGATRAEAMRHMAARTGVDTLSSLAAILIQTEKFGTSIADTLTVFATSLREERSFMAEENAEKMAVKLLFPMVLFIFPAVLITVAGPAVITIARVMIFGGS
jgi:tight adherence protein C